MSGSDVLFAVLVFGVGYVLGALRMHNAWTAQFEEFNEWRRKRGL